ncbi:G1/S-specific cyclin-E1 [Neolamprologus brichardi]|uniref:G1/S-specific cyclin-E1 n=1 Tax=Neolamprologus brichardi TaxID=32507 RepID=UPI0003EBFC7E|nr:G1/S-specific cyclin-E1 [Neolamprologus brichardi]
MSGQFPGSPRSGGVFLGALESGLLPRSPRQAEPGFVGRKAARSGGWGRCTSHFYGCLSLNFTSFVVPRFAPTDASTAPTIMRGTREDTEAKSAPAEAPKHPTVRARKRKADVAIPKMRAILLDWLMEVSEVYKLHRETYHLAQDYFDRFMATQRNVLKSTLQLIGITCLFIAAKVEEMYPPKVHQFAYVTDEACTEDEILSMEIIIMKELKWSLSPQTPVSWLNVYMQVAYLKDTDELLLPRYPQPTFTHIAELLDLCMLDVRCLEFSNGVLAASALFHFSSLELVENVSALKRVEVEECVRWMVPFAMALREVGSSPMKTFPGISADDMHNIQTHAPYATWLEKAYSYQEVELQCHGGCPVPSGVLTPPLSSEKTEEPDRGEATVVKIRASMESPPPQ